MYPCFTFAPSILFSSDLQSDPGAVALKRTSPLPPILEPPNHPDNMDGFYDQQVPFMVPPSVSGHTSASIITTLNSWLCVMDAPPPPVATMDHCTFIAYLDTICIVHWEGSGIFCWCSDVFFIFFLSQQHKSHVEESSHNRPLNDRKRKFVDTELAQDTEGNIALMPWMHFCWLSCVLTCNYFGGNLSSICFTSWFPELFQDLSQLQEIWIAEGEFHHNFLLNVSCVFCWTLYRKHSVY